MDKPLVITLREVKERFAECANSALRELPCFLLEPILADLYKQVSAGALQEYEHAKKQISEEETKQEVTE